MEAVLEKTAEKVVPKLVIPEDKDLQVVRFQNLESSGTPLEFSAGAPISAENRNYVLKDGRCYYLGKRLRAHITDKGYPIYTNVPDPSDPTSGIMRSMQTGFKHRFGLTIVDNPKSVTVYEHLREKLNHKILPGAYTNTVTIPGKKKHKLPPTLMEDRFKEIETENEGLKEQIGQMTKKFDKAMESNQILIDGLNQSKDAARKDSKGKKEKK